MSNELQKDDVVITPIKELPEEMLDFILWQAGMIEKAKEYFRRHSGISAERLGRTIPPNQLPPSNSDI